jgi:hypothetical protein
MEADPGPGPAVSLLQYHTLIVMLIVRNICVDKILQRIVHALGKNRIFFRIRISIYCCSACFD